MTPHNTALVFSGGGAHAAFQVGAASYLYDSGFVNRIFAGASAGAMNAAFLAQAQASEQRDFARRLRNVWSEQLRPSIVYRKRWGSTVASFVSGLWRPALFDGEPLRRHIQRIIDPAKIHDSGTALRVLSCGLRSGGIYVAREDDPDIRDWVYRSGLFPGVLLPDSWGDEQWADGGLREQTPVGAAIAAGARHIVVLSTFFGIGERPPMEPVKTVLDSATRAILWILEEAERNDLSILSKRNALAAAGVPGHEHIDLTVIRPTEEFARHAFDFDAERMRKAMEHGYARSEQVTSPTA